MDKLYDEAFNYFKTPRILFRGFMLEKNKGVVSITDIRTPYYRPISEKDLEVLLERGFMKGTTYLLMMSDNSKIKRYTKLIELHSRALKEVINPRKKEEYKNSIVRHNLEIKYYKSQVRRWHNLISI